MGKTAIEISATEKSTPLIELLFGSSYGAYGVFSKIILNAHALVQNENTAFFLGSGMEVFANLISC